MTLRNKLDLTVIVVNYNTREMLDRCLSSIYRTTRHIRFEIIVVDNRSSDGSVDMVMKKHRRARLISNEDNRGFAAANNQAINKSRGKYILLLNPDTEVFEGTLETMVRFMEENPEAGVCGCRILLPDGDVQLSIFSYPTPLKEFLKLISLDRVILSISRLEYGRSGHLNSYFAPYGEYDRMREVDCVSGACFMVRKRALEDVGLLDENFFMYHEEREWCYRFRQKGWKICYIPSAQIVHYRSPGGIINLDRRIFNEYYKGIIYFISKHSGRGRVVLLKTLLALGCSVRIPMEIIQGAIKRDPSLRDRLVRYSDVFQLAVFNR